MYEYTVECTQTLLSCLINRLLLTVFSKCFWIISNQDFFLEETPSLNASLGLHKISSGIRSNPVNDDRRRCFSTPSCGCLEAAGNDR